ncbi:MAG: hypothetical protein HKM94_07230 [Halobacteria archaeon]|nr:hypothetical protein [Halobacteria archaeon]
MNRQMGILAVAISALCVGVMVYVVDRQAEYIYFLPDWLSLEHQIGGLFGSIGNYLPTFIHVYAFILLTVVVAVPSVTKLIPVCLAWFTLDSLFEFAQLNPIAQWIGSHTPGWFSAIPFLENTADYFLMGTFDVFDLFSIAIGTLAAYLTVIFCIRSAKNVAYTEKT